MNKQELKKRIVIDKQSPVPFYYQFKQGLLSAIKDGYFSQSEKLPTEAEFTELFEISRPTVRQALQELINEGYIVRKKAKGTFLKDAGISSMFFRELQSFASEMAELGFKTKTEVIGCELVKRNYEDLASVFDEEDQEFLKLERLRSADDKKVVFCTSFLPAYLFPGELPDFTNESLYTILADSNHQVMRVERKFTAVNATKKLVEYLELQPREALLKVFTKAYDEHGKIVEYSVAYYTSITYFKMDLTKNK